MALGRYDSAAKAFRRGLKVRADWSDSPLRLDQIYGDEQIAKTGKLLDSAQTIVGDPQIREDLKTSLANLRTTIDTANRVAVGLEQFSNTLPKLTTDASAAVGEFRVTIGKTHFRYSVRN